MLRTEILFRIMSQLLSDVVAAVYMMEKSIDIFFTFTLGTFGKAD